MKHPKQRFKIDFHTKWELYDPIIIIINITFIVSKKVKLSDHGPNISCSSFAYNLFSEICIKLMYMFANDILRGI